MNGRFGLLAVALGSVFAGAAAAGAQEIVYDSFRGFRAGVVIIHEIPETSSAGELTGGLENVGAAGDIAVLAGTARELSQVQLQFWRWGTPPTSGPLSAQVTLSLYTVEDDAPGAQLWTGQSPVSIGQGQISGVASFPLDLVVPDAVVFAYSLSDIIDDGVSTVHAGFTTVPPSVGSSPVGGMVQDSSTLLWTQWPESGWGIEARFIAVPGPAGTGLFAAFGVVLARSRRRR